MAQARHIEQSAAFAKAIEASLRERVPMSPRAMQQAPFRVLVGANMPAVLVEMGFLTNAAAGTAARRPTTFRTPSCRPSLTASCAIAGRRR